MANIYWSSPKINWTETDVTTIDDLNRWESNSLAIWNQASPTGDTSGTSLAYTLTIPDISLLQEGTAVTAVIHVDSGDDPTFNLNSLGAKPLVKSDGTNVKAGEFPTGAAVQLIHINNTWQAIIPVKDFVTVEQGLYGTDTGVADAYLVTLSGITSYDEGLSFSMKVTNNNTGASTININSLGVKDLKNVDGQDLSTNQLKSGGIYKFVYDGTSVQLVSNDNGLAQLAFFSPYTLSLQEISVTTPTADDPKFSIDITSLITGGNITMKRNGAGALNVYSDYALTEPVTELEAGMHDFIDRGTAFYFAARGGGYTAWAQQYTGANEIIKDPKLKDVVVGVGEYVLNEHYSTVVDGYVIPSLTNATWDEELKLLTEIPEGTKDTIVEKLISHTVILDGSETYTTFASGQGLNNDLALMRLPAYLDANNYYNDNTIAIGFAIGNDGIGDYDARSSTGALTGRGFTINGTDNLFIAIPESALNTVDAAGFVEYIKKNPIKFKVLFASPVTLNDTILKMNNPDDYKVYEGFITKENLFTPDMNKNGEPIATPGTIYTQELISHVGSGIIHFYKTEGGTSLEVDGEYVTNISGARVEINFNTGYRLLSNSLSNGAIIQHTDRDEKAAILTANLSAASGYSLQLSDTGRGELSTLGIQANTKIIIDTVTLLDHDTTVLGLALESLKIPYYESFEIYATSALTQNYSRII